MKRIALLGMPDTGQSTFFNRLTGAGIARSLALAWLLSSVFYQGARC